jgi:hypothetical protein
VVIRSKGALISVHVVIIITSILMIILKVYQVIFSVSKEGFITILLLLFVCCYQRLELTNQLTKLLKRVYDYISTC